VTGTETIYGSALKDGDGHGTHCAGVIGAVGFNQRGVVGGELLAWSEFGSVSRLVCLNSRKLNGTQSIQTQTCFHFTFPKH
jgi:subtilisin family serine protease